MKYLGAITHDNDIATKKYVDDHCGGGGIASVTVTPIQTTGTQIATISVDGSAANLYAPTPPAASSTNPVMDGTAAVGTSANYARADHKHPSDTSRVPTTRTINSKALSSNITLSASDVSAIPNNYTLTSSGLAAHDGRCAVTSGGYYTIGNAVIVNLKLTIKASLASNDYWTILQGLPSPSFESALACAGIAKGGTGLSAYVGTNGALIVVLDQTALANNDVITVGGIYRKA